MVEGLAVEGLSVRFGGVSALDDVDLAVEPGEIVGLVGPNGAGKSTLVNCVGGQLEPTRGRVLLDGRPLNGRPTYQRARLGVGRTFQRIAVFPELTVREHLFIAARALRPGGTHWSELVDRARPKEAEAAAVDATLERVGLVDRADAPVGTLPLGVCRLVEIARALVGGPRVVLADEPSSGLDQAEGHTLATVLRSVAAERTGVLLVEHDLGIVSTVCDRVVVLHLGVVIAQGSFAEVMADPGVQRAYLGHVA
jgi:ABC-type branched-subunit amino acid transport system ATPase component